ncbi:MAG: succinylglutamate desuccinylase/aspartoacylase family protein [Proteobacteria bacterium]|nr:succinylglutamate desuccinylase/aspartoacylase family protein [Pseudomonadota bacterium]
MSELKPEPGLHFKSITYTGQAPGPRVIILGAVHGNEICGTRAIHRVLDDIDNGRLSVVGGSLTLVPVANPLAYARGQREGERNLNRNLTPTEQPADFEDHVANWLCPLLARHEVLLDLHSFRAQAEAFVMIGPLNNSGDLQPFSQATEERALARRLGVHRCVDGWLGTYALGVERRIRLAISAGRLPDARTEDACYGVGTTEYMRSVGGYALTLECGQHDDPSAPEVAYQAILRTLSYLGLTPTAAPAATEEMEALSLYEVIDKIHADDAFSRAWASFDRLARGDLIGTRHDGTPVVAEDDAVIVFPDAKAKAGREWFYLARANPEF